MQPAAGEPSPGWRAATVLLWLAFLWAAGTAVYVYAVLDGGQLFRLETASYILASCALPFLVRRARVTTFRPDVAPVWLLAAGALAVAAWLGMFLRLLDFPLLSDDYGFRSLYSQPFSFFAGGQFFRPLFGLVFRWLDAIGGRTSPVPLHLASMALHLTSAALVGVLASRLIRGRDAAVLAFVVFLLNPLQLEVVLWVSGLQELLWTTALLGAVVVYTRSTDVQPLDSAATTLLVAASLLSKETAVAAVLILPCAGGFLYGWRRGRWMLVTYTVVVLELIVYLVVRARAVTLDSSFLVPPSRFFFKQMISMPYKTFVQPWNLDAVHPAPWILCAAALAALAALFAVCLQKKADWRLFFGPAVILASTLPVYSYFFIDANLMASRYLYFAAAGWAILVADVVTRIAPSRAYLLTALVIVVGADVLSLNLNLRPWRTVGSMVADMRTRIASGQSRDEVISYWQNQLGDDLVMKDGLPISYRGVYVFGNGLPEFERQIRSSVSPEP